ncbi:DUF1450 domain-containing protein [Haloarchaeobius sp. TZWSO28]|uniref:DUF1450 domain-containing protein n=1 Tax=Haloarchaeobius sp. TZWSO28 TaxID=3446119 RepID=UPI003EB7B216
MPPVVECCVRNLTVSDRQRLDVIDASIRVAPCLEHCGTCRHEPFVLVDGSLHAGDEYEHALTSLGGDIE